MDLSRWMKLGSAYLSDWPNASLQVPLADLQRGHTSSVAVNALAHSLTRSFRRQALLLCDYDEYEAASVLNFAISELMTTVGRSQLKNRSVPSISKFIHVVMQRKVAQRRKSPHVVRTTTMADDMFSVIDPTTVEIEDRIHAEIDQEQRMQLVEAGMAKLPSRDREWLMQRVKDVPFKEIAAESGVTSGCVRSAVDRAKRALRGEGKS